MTFDPNNPLANLPSQGGEQTEDDTDFDQFLTTIQDSGFEYDGLTTPGEGAVGQEEADEVGDGSLDTPLDGSTHSQPPPTPTTSPDSIRIGDKDVPLSEVRAFYELGKMFREGALFPDTAGAGGATAGPGDGGQAQPLAPAPIEPLPVPAFIDQEDEDAVAAWTQMQEREVQLRKDLADTRSMVDQINAATSQQAAMENTRTAVTQFRTQYNHITDDEMSVLFGLCAPMVESFVRQYKDPVEGVKRALYVAALDNPATRERILSTGKTPQQQSKERKAKLGSLSGSSGSSPRSAQPRPQLSTDKQAVSEFAKELSEAYSANGRIN